MNEEIGIISGVEYGCRDGHIGLHFVVHMKIFSSSQFLTPNETTKLCEKHNIEDISELEGKPCIVTSNLDLVNKKSVFKELFSY